MPTTPPVRVGIVGVGLMARYHLSNMLPRDDTHVVAVCEPSAMAFFRYANSGTRVHTCRDPYLDLLRLRGNAFAVTQRARFTASSGSLTVGTRLRKLKPAACPHNLARAFAGRALDNRSARVARSLAS